MALRFTVRWMLVPKKPTVMMVAATSPSSASRPLMYTTGEYGPPSWLTNSSRPPKPSHSTSANAKAASVVHLQILYIYSCVGANCW